MDPYANLLHSCRLNTFAHDEENDMGCVCKNKMALVTSGAAGIGQASASARAPAGARVLVADVVSGHALAVDGDIVAR